MFYMPCYCDGKSMKTFVMLLVPFDFDVDFLIH